MTKYQCRYCFRLGKYFDTFEAQLHFWREHDEFISKDDLFIGFRKKNCKHLNKTTKQNDDGTYYTICDDCDKTLVWSKG